MSPKEFRSIVKRGEWTESTSAACRGYAVANLAIVPKELAFDFLLFCNRNPRPCPVLEVIESGDPHTKLVAPGADLCTDVPKYRVYRDGKLIDEPTDITGYWRDDLVSFVIGCSDSWDWSLRAANIEFRVIGAYTTSIACVPAGRFRGHMVVTCRLMKDSYNAVRAVQITSRHTATHGPPIHIGNPAIIGIKDLYRPDICQNPALGDVITPQEPDEVALFWGCGATPQIAAMESKVPFMITHYPDHMFITDKLSEELAVL